MIRVGSDETLKGDTFGGLIVTAVRVDDHLREQLENLGIQDSKKISDNKIKALAHRLDGLVPAKTIALSPAEYNEEVEKFGLVKVMDKLHTSCINALREGTNEVVVDKYPGCQVQNAQLVEKAESQYVEVATASVIARAAALQQFAELSTKAGFELPMGSTHVLDALLRLRNEGKPLNAFAKTSFRNVRDIMLQEQQNLYAGDGEQQQ